MARPLHVERTITTPAARPRVFAWLSDFRTTEVWDPGTIRTTLLTGDGEVGTVYANESRFAGRTVRLEYVVTELVPDKLIVLRGEGPSVVTHDRMSLRDLSKGGTELVYSARFDFSGTAGLVSPLLRPLLRRIGDETAARLRETLSNL